MGLILKMDCVDQNAEIRLRRSKHHNKERLNYCRAATPNGKDVLRIAFCLWLNRFTTEEDQREIMC